MLNRNVRNRINQSVNLNLNAALDSKFKNGFFNFLLKRLKQKEQKEKKEKFIFFVATVGVLIISGIIISF